jgi:starvation-inducible outer membrane lipoprotein
MQATPRCTIIALLAVMLASCAWQPTPLDHTHALSAVADKAANDSAKCQSSGAALGSQAYKQCRALLEDKMSIEKDVPPDRGYARTRP